MEHAESSNERIQVETLPERSGWLKMKKKNPRRFFFFNFVVIFSLNSYWSVEAFGTLYNNHLLQMVNLWLIKL